jgi:hypothetical protein
MLPPGVRRPPLFLIVRCFVADANRGRYEIGAALYLE